MTILDWNTAPISLFERITSTFAFSSISDLDSPRSQYGFIVW